MEKIHFEFNKLEICFVIFPQTVLMMGGQKKAIAFQMSQVFIQSKKWGMVSINN